MQVFTRFRRIKANWPLENKNDQQIKNRENAFYINNNKKRKKIFFYIYASMYGHLIHQGENLNSHHMEFIF